MMDTRPTPSIAPAEQSHLVMTESFSVSELIERLTGFLTRQFAVFIFVTACAMALGFVYLFTSPALYTAHTNLVIDSSKVRVLQQQQGQALGDVPVDTAQVETQLEVLKSDGVSLAVVNDHNLTKDPEFMAGRGRGMLNAILNFAFGRFGPSEATSESVLTRRAVGILKGNRTVTRVGRTYVLDIAYTALTPGTAATVANAIADAYITDQLESKYQATRRASAWLQDRIKELRTQASAADIAVLEYKEKNNIVDFGGASPTSAVGARLMGEQELQELTTQLGAARNTNADAKAKLERIQEVMTKEIPDAAVADSLHNDIINKLRQQYLDYSARETIFSARYGPNHLAVVNLRTQMRELKRSIADELARIAESYKSDYEIAKGRQEQLEQNLAKLVSSSRTINRDRLGLRELESQAQVHHTIYESFLQRYMEAVQQQSFPITEARVISAAQAPSGKSSPLTIPVLAVAAIIGLVLSFGIATLREAVDRVFRTTRQVEETLRNTCLAVLPMLNKKSAGNADRKGNKSAELPDSDQTFIASPGELFRHAVDQPLSPFAESLRSIKVAADIAGVIKNNKVIGVTSTLPREGKSTVACNLAQLIAHAGKNAILVDGDLRNPTLTKGLASDASIGLLEVIGGKVELTQALRTDGQTKLDFLPIVRTARLAHTNEILASDAFRDLIEKLQKKYDYVVVDLPPLAPVVDARATAHVIDTYLYVIEWGKTRMNVVQHELASAPQVAERLLGFVLNKANLRVLGRYEHYYGSYYRKYYGRYGHYDDSRYGVYGA
jgi:succinoglycan biosynthesis transport protein ExoP